MDFMSAMAPLPESNDCNRIEQPKEMETFTSGSSGIFNRLPADFPRSYSKDSSIVRPDVGA